jgi:hypothetical protein
VATNCTVCAQCEHDFVHAREHGSERLIMFLNAGICPMWVSTFEPCTYSTIQYVCVCINIIIIIYAI